MKLITFESKNPINRMLLSVGIDLDALNFKSDPRECRFALGQVCLPLVKNQTTQKIQKDFC